MTSQGGSGPQTSYQHLCEVLRGVLVDVVQAGRHAGTEMGAVPSRATAALYLILRNHPVDRRGRCRSCRRPGAWVGRRWRRCRVHGEARLWLHQPAEFLRPQLARELRAHLGPPPQVGATPERHGSPGAVPPAEPDTQHSEMPAAVAAEGDSGTPAAQTPVGSSPLPPHEDEATGPDHGGAGPDPDAPGFAVAHHPTPAGPSASRLRGGTR
ncbi:MAG: hypothetical protein ABR608_13960 [Pseudonocardiaceae bacterium]